MIDDKTPNLNLPLPAAANPLKADVERLRDALSAIDAAVAGKAPQVHGHAIDDVAGLAAELLTKVEAAALAAVAFSGAYSDLTGTPAPFSGDYNDLTNKPTLFSGAYADLTGTPTNVSVFINDAGYVTSAGVAAGYQPLDADLTAIGTLAGTSGLLRKTGANSWTLDTTGYLTTNQTITVSGDATGSGSTSIALTLKDTTVTPGTYTTANITVDAKGRITAAANGSSTTYPSAGIPVSTGTAWGTPLPNPQTIGLYENTASIAADYTITAGSNAMSAGPVAVAAGFTITIPTGSTWTVV